MGGHAAGDVAGGHADPTGAGGVARDRREAGFRLHQKVVGFHFGIFAGFAVAGNIDGNQPWVLDAQIVGAKPRPRRRAGCEAPENKGADGLNNSWSFGDPDIGVIATSWSALKPPKGMNWGSFSDPVADDLAARAKVEFDVAKQNELLAQLHARYVDQAMWIWVVHDLNPRAMSPKVKGFVSAQSWYQDLTPVSNA